MKKIFAVILTFVILCVFTGCTKAEEINPIAYESCTVDVSNIVKNKELFENRIPSTREQMNLRESIIQLIEKIEGNETVNFKVTFSEELFNSWEECNNYAEAVKPGKTHLGSYSHYYLWLAQRIINEETKWENICDEEKVLPTIAFSERRAWVGSCTNKCFLDYRTMSTEAYVHGLDYHAYSGSHIWQAFVVESV